MKSTFTMGQIIDPYMVLPENKFTCKVAGITMILHQGKVDYGIIHSDGITYFVIPKRFNGERYAPYRCKLKPRSLYAALKRGTNTILGVADYHITDIAF